MQEVLPYVIFYKAAIGLLVTGLGTLMLFPIRKARAEWVSLKESTAAIQKELETQRINCLSILQTQGDRQIELLEKVAGTLGDISISQSRMTGFCEANALSAACVRPRKRLSKKAY